MSLPRLWLKVSDDGMVVSTYTPAQFAKIPSSEITPMRFFSDPLEAFLVASERRRLRQWDPNDRRSREAWTVQRVTS